MCFYIIGVWEDDGDDDPLKMWAFQIDHLEIQLILLVHLLFHVSLIILHHKNCCMKQPNFFYPLVMEKSQTIIIIGKITKFFTGKSMNQCTSLINGHVQLLC